jgi:hypothetical protein
MSPRSLDERYSQLASNFMVDVVTAEVAGALGREGIEVLVLKGPVLARWLYPGETRPYGDSDLMVAPGDHARAVGVVERLGFVAYVPWKPVPSLLPVNLGRTAFSRDGGVMVDLHHQLPGLEGDSDAIWKHLSENAAQQRIGGLDLRVLDRDALLLHVALHAAQHSNVVGGKPVEDLRRALALVEEARWSGALQLARAYRGVPAFVAGLRLLPEGGDLARRLGLAEVRSVGYELRRENMVAEELYALLRGDMGTGRKLAIVVRRLFPPSDYMRWGSQLARRGKLGLAGVYVRRTIWVIFQAPGAIRALWRVRGHEG